MPMIGRADNFFERRTIQSGGSRSERWRWCCDTILVLMLRVLFRCSDLKNRIRGTEPEKPRIAFAPSRELKVGPARLSRPSDDDRVSHACLCLNQESLQRRKKVVNVHGYLRLQTPLDHKLPSHLRRPWERIAWPGSFFDQTLPERDRLEGERYL